jgi:hypothetical protein
MTSDSVNAEHAVIVFARDDADKSAIVAAFHAQRAPICRQRENAADRVNPRRFRLIGKHAGGDDFRLGKADGGDGHRPEFAGHAGNDFGDHFGLR